MHHTKSICIYTLINGFTSCTHHVHNDYLETRSYQSHEIVLVNWAINKHVFCNDNNNIPIKIPSHPYVLLKRTILCNCRIEAEDIFLLESTAACPGKQSALTMYYTVNTAFMHYFDSLTDNLDTQILQNWTMQEPVLPILLQTFVFDSKLLKTPKTLKDFVYQYQQKTTNIAQK